MASQVTEWFPLPEVAEGIGAWDSPRQHHTASKEKLILQPSKAKGSVKASTAGSYGLRSTQPQLYRTVHPSNSCVTPTVSSPRVSMELSSQSSTLLYTPAETVTTSYSKHHNHGSRNASHKATRLTSGTSSYLTKPETPSSETATRLVPPGVGDLTITSILSTSGQSEPGEVVTGQDLHPYPIPHHYPSDCVGRVASRDALTSYTSGDYVSKASGNTKFRGYSQPLTSYGASELSRMAHDPPSTQLVPTLTLTELDQLWRRFLSSSLSSHWPPPRKDQTIRKGTADYPTRSATTSSGGHLHCTCHKSTVPHAVPSVDISCTMMQDHYTELLGMHGRQDGNRPGAQQLDPRTRSLGLSKLDFTHVHVPACHPNTANANFTHSRMVDVQDTSVQTSPSLHVPPTMPHPPPISFSISRQQQAHNSTGWPQEQKEHTLTQLTLQEALTAFRPDFIQQSCERQRSLRQKQRERVDGRHRPPPIVCREGAWPPPIENRKGALQSEKTPKFFFVDASNCRPRMSMRQMYQQSKRYWHQLPEVCQKVTQEKRRSEAATNRLRVKLYQKEVLARLRRKRRT